MDRNEYLTRCRECAKITARIWQAKWQQAVPEELLVFVDGSAYIPHGLKIWFDIYGNVHHCLCFIKGDPKKATERIGEIGIPDMSVYETEDEYV